MLNKFIVQILIIFALITILFIFLFPSPLSASINKFWKDTSCCWGHEVEVSVESGYWRVTDYRVWVKDGFWDTRYRYVSKWVPCNKTFYYGTDSYGWSVYSSFAKEMNRRFEGTINGNRYKYRKFVIDYRPVYGGQCYAEKYECFEILKKVLESYKVWVDTSHWETQKKYDWIDTSHLEFEDKQSEDGSYVSPFHGELIVEKEPEYVFTKWHKDKYNNECSMNLSISWKVDNSNLYEGEEEKKIVRLYVYEDVCRFGGEGMERVIIFDENIPHAAEGNIDTVTKFEYSGSEESLLHIYLFAQNGESAHICFSNPINGFRSINLMPEGSSTNANEWLGGISYERFEF